VNNWDLRATERLTEKFGRERREIRGYNVHKAMACSETFATSCMVAEACLLREEMRKLELKKEKTSAIMVMLGT
jgi:hypothetical protein